MKNELKTCEEYVLRELAKKEEELELVHKRISELEDKLKTNDDNINFEKVIKVSETPSCYFWVDTLRRYNYNQMLIKHNKTPEFLKDENNIDEIISWSNENMINSNAYLYLIKNYKGNIAVVSEYNDGSMHLCNIDNKTYFLNSNEAVEGLKLAVKEEIKEYFEYDYDKKFKVEE